VRRSAAVEALTKEDGRYSATTSDRRFVADTFVVATGVFRKPYTPDFAGDLDPAITQLHSNDYRNPSQLQEGPLLVVGASHSGSDIAYEASASHEVILSGTDTGQLPVPVESRRGRIGFRVLVFAGTHILNVNTPLGRKMRPTSVTEADRCFATAEGPARGRSRARRRAHRRCRRWPTGAQRRSRPRRAERRLVHRFPARLQLDPPPARVGDDGYPVQYRGAAASSPGLYFVGLPFLHSFASMLIAGSGRDSEHVARQILRDRAPAPNGKTGEVARAPVTS